MTMLLLLCSMVACASALIHNDAKLKQVSCVADVSSRCKAAALPVKCADWVNTVTDPEYDKFHEFGASKARVADAVRTSKALRVHKARDQIVNIRSLHTPRSSAVQGDLCEQ